MPNRYSRALLFATCTWGSLFGQAVNSHAVPQPSQVVTVENRSGQPWRLQLAAESIHAQHRYRFTPTPGAERDLTLSAVEHPQAALEVDEERSVTLPAHSLGHPFTLRFPAGQWPGPIEMKLKDHRGTVDCWLKFTPSMAHHGTQVVSVELAPDWAEAEAVAAVVQTPTPSAVVIREGQYRSTDVPPVPKPAATHNHQLQPKKLF